MNIFANVINNWSTYEWVMILGSLLSIFLISNSVTYFLTKNLKYCIPLTLTYINASVLSVLLYFLTSLIFKLDITNLTLLSVLVITVFININWFAFVGYFVKHKDNKNFSLVELFTEYSKDTIRLIIFLLLLIAAICVFLTPSYLPNVIITAVVSGVAMYANTIFVRKFIND
jgi:hypothetical protein